MIRSLTFAVVIGLILSTWADAGGEAPPKDQQSVDSKGGKRPRAAAIDFNKELGLPYPSLSTLGARIDAARRAGDPVGLAHAAQELAVAEKVSSKTAPVTFKDVWDESYQLAKLRQEVSELRALLHMTNQMADQEARANALKSDLASAQELAQAEAEAAKTGDDSAKLHRVYVHNRTDQIADVYANGQFKIRIPPYESRWFAVEAKRNPVVLTGYGSGDISWGPRYVWGTFAKYTWNLN